MPPRMSLLALTQSVPPRMSPRALTQSACLRRCALHRATAKVAQGSAGPCYNFGFELPCLCPGGGAVPAWCSAWRCDQHTACDGGAESPCRCPEVGGSDNSDYPDDPSWGMESCVHTEQECEVCEGELIADGSTQPDRLGKMFAGDTHDSRLCMCHHGSWGGMGCTSGIELGAASWARPSECDPCFALGNDGVYRCVCTCTTCSRTNSYYYEGTPFKVWSADADATYRSNFTLDPADLTSGPAYSNECPRFKTPPYFGVCPVSRGSHVIRVSMCESCDRPRFLICIECWKRFLCVSCDRGGGDDHKL